MAHIPNTRKDITMTEPLNNSPPGSYPPVVIHLSGDSITTTKLTIYKPDYTDDKTPDPATSLSLYGDTVENLCKILDAWRVKLKFTENEE